MEGTVKSEPELQSPAFPEPDIYEDTGDLEFNPDEKYQNLFLARVPKSLWDSWSKLPDDAEIRIGTIRQITETNEHGEQRQAVQMMLSSDLSEHQLVPKEYTLDIVSETTENTYTFTEQDLPGYKTKPKKFDPASANIPSRLNRRTPIVKQPYDPNKKYQERFRKAIPKCTTLAGKFAHEVNCVAVKNEESKRFLDQPFLDALKKPDKTLYLGKNVDLQDLQGSGFTIPGTVAAQAGKWTNFVRTNGGAPPGKKPQLQKTARMPENELLDKIFDCFRRYTYWSMKAFRQELQQPEAYLRETLEKIAILHKSGPYSTQWSLKPENKLTNYTENDIAAPTLPAMDGIYDSAADDEDEDEDVKFEDV
ncbi:putative transcription initiation factor IIF subunit beta [Amylocarpus encephaloides]|uniref:Transcription initiation factor IIF subunit beta n=1 Tax=Amylocarpus encephaloides TaxID=45428 RepID=A0A9P8C804_9HELO|nr:putative transcription initiation factor IIF subunit beta [Amylocarpus encephaloides]